MFGRFEAVMVGLVCGLILGVMFTGVYMQFTDKVDIDIRTYKYYDNELTICKGELKNCENKPEPQCTPVVCDSGTGTFFGTILGVLIALGILKAIELHKKDKKEKKNEKERISRKKK